MRTVGAGAAPSVQADVALGRRLRAAHYDLAIDFHSGPRGSLLTWLSGAKNRIGSGSLRSWLGGASTRTSSQGPTAKSTR